MTSPFASRFWLARSVARETTVSATRRLPRLRQLTVFRIAAAGSIATGRVIALGPFDLAVRVADAAQKRLEPGAVARERRGQHHLAEGHAVERVVADDENLLAPRSADQGIRPVARAEQRVRDEGHPLGNRGQRARIRDQALDRRSRSRERGRRCGKRYTREE